MGDAYRQLREKAGEIGEVTAAESFRFDQTLDRGLELIAGWL
jgi:alanyl-tRNA synthetase